MSIFSPFISRMPQSPPAYSAKTPVRITFHVEDVRMGEEILEHLTEEKLTAGGTIIEARAINWIGGELQRENRKIVTAYTTAGKLPLIRGRLEVLYGEDTPAISQFLLQDSHRAVDGWIERNVRE